MPTTDSSRILWRYAAIERETQTLIESRCHFVCTDCHSGCCCRADICEEAFDSALLKKLHGEKRSSSRFSDRYGWLTPQGCSLALGRPPVCYEFFCEEILHHLPDDTHRYILKTLGKLVSHVGRDSSGKNYLIEIRTEEELDQVDLAPFYERVSEAKAALAHIRTFYDHGELEHDGLEQLRKIEEPPEHL